MKISIISDSHMGFGSGTERFEDTFEAFREALERSLGSDIILLPGDIFDTKVPTTEILTRAMELLLKPKLRSNRVKVLDGTKPLKGLSPLNLSGIPVVAIHGTHERRVKGVMNPIQALERAGFLLYLQCNSLVFEKDGERVCIHGMGGVPEQYAESVLKEWDPKPVEGCRNLLVLHQTISGFIPAPNTLPRESLPKGFDLTINGHLHEPKHDGSLLVAGSLIQTQLGKESANPRGFWTLDTEKMELEFQKLENQRPVYHLQPAGIEEAEKSLGEILSQKHMKKPLVRINISGRDFSSDIQSRFGENALLSFKKDKAEETFTARSPEEQKLSVEELGKKLLSASLLEQGLEPGVFEHIFELLQEKKPEDALELLKEHLKEPLQKLPISQESPGKEHEHLNEPENN